MPLSLFAMVVHLFSFSCSYHKLLVARYGSKWERCQEVKRRSTEGWGPIREMEWTVDVDLFLNTQNQWAEDSPHCLILLYEMFLHAVAKGQKEAKWVTRQGCLWHMPQLDPRAALPAIQLVHPGISRRELLDLYLEVYKLYQMPGLPPGELATLQEISSTIPVLMLEEEESPGAQKPSHHKDLHSLEDRHSHQERVSSLDQSLARVREAHWQVLSTAATLEAEIERLHRLRVCPTERRHRSRTQWELERRKRWGQVSFATPLTSGQSAEPDLPQGKTGSGSKDSDLGDPPKLKAEVASFLQGSSEMSGVENPPLEPPVSQPADWVRWRAEECNLPTWWRELTAVQGEDAKTLAREVRASFQFPWHRHELDPMEAPYHATPAPPCLRQWRFMPPGQSTFASQDIREIPREKTVAYAWALQYYVEWSNLLRRSQPCLLAESVLELREEVGFYLSSRMKKSFKGWTSPNKRVTALLPLLSWLSLKFRTLLMSLRHLQHWKQFLSILAGRQSCIPPNWCTLQGKHPHQPLSLDQEEDLEYLPILPHPVHLKLCHCQCLLLPHGH